MCRFLIAGLLAASTPAALAQESPPPVDAPTPMVVARMAPPTSQPGTLFVEQDTLIRLMVVNEVSTRTAKPGDRFVLRVDEPVVVGASTIFKVGTKAWGEVTSADKSGAVGKAGKLSARLLYIEAGEDRVALAGDTRNAGQKGTTQVAMAALGLGPLALFAPGNNAKLKAGEIFNAYLESDMLFDPATSRLTPLAAPAAAVATQ